MTDITVVSTPVIVEVSPQVYTVTVSSVGVQGATGSTGVVSATDPITYNSTTKDVGFNATGFVKTAIANTFTVGAQIIKTGADAIKGLTLTRNSSSQSANLLSVTASDGTTELARIRPNGQLGVGSLITNALLGLNQDQVADNRGLVIKAGVSSPTNNAIEILPLANNTPLMKVDASGNVTAPSFVGDVTGNVSGNAGTVTNGVYTADKGVANGVATLDGSGLIPTSQLPPLAISDTFVVASQAAMLALTAQVGDVAVRTDVNKTFILQATPPTSLGNWVQILTPPAITSITADSPLTGGTITSTGTIGISDASTTVKGAVQLTDSTSSTSTTTAATPNSVKTAYDLANGKVSSVGNAPSDTSITIAGTATAPTVKVNTTVIAPLASPALTGTPTTTTATVDTNTTQIASTAFVLGQAASAAATPTMDGTAAVGTSTRYARADHVHGSDTSKASLGSANTFTTGTQIIATGADTTVGLRVKRNSATQSANIVEVTQSDGTTILAKIDSAGNITAPTFVGALTGNASTVTNGIYTTTTLLPNVTSVNGTPIPASNTLLTPASVNGYLNGSTTGLDLYPRFHALGTTASTAMTSGTIRTTTFIPMSNISVSNVSVIVTAAKSTSGSTTEFGRFALASYDGTSTYTILARTAQTTGFASATGLTTIALDSTVSLTAGTTYAILFLWYSNATVVTTTPSIAGSSVSTTISFASPKMGTSATGQTDISATSVTASSAAAAISWARLS